MKTRIWLKRLMAAAVAMQVGAACAEDSPWTLRLGASYRDFDKMEINGVDFRNWGQSNTAPFGVQDVTTVVGNPLDAPVILDYARFDGDKAGLNGSGSSKWAPIIGFDYDLTPTCTLGLSVVGNFQYYRLGARNSATGDVGAPGTFTVEQYQHWWVDTSLPPDFIPDTLTPGVLLLGPSLPGTTFAVRSKFNMDLYVLDFGLQARAVGGAVRLTLAAGPSLTIARAKSSQNQQASWLAQGPGLPAGSYAQKASDSSLDFLLGAYGAVGVAFDISPSWSIGVECRYDYVDGDVGTNQVNMDLSSFSGVVRLAYQF